MSPPSVVEHRLAIKIFKITILNTGQPCTYANFLWNEFCDAGPTYQPELYPRATSPPAPLLSHEKTDPFLNVLFYFNNIGIKLTGIINASSKLPFYLLWIFSFLQTLIFTPVYCCEQCKKKNSNTLPGPCCWWQFMIPNIICYKFATRKPFYLDRFTSYG